MEMCLYGLCSAPAMNTVGVDVFTDCGISDAVPAPNSQRGVSIAVVPDRIRESFLSPIATMVLSGLYSLSPLQCLQGFFTFNDQVRENTFYKQDQRIRSGYRYCSQCASVAVFVVSPKTGSYTHSGFDALGYQKRSDVVENAVLLRGLDDRHLGRLIGWLPSDASLTVEKSSYIGPSHG